MHVAFLYAMVRFWAALWHTIIRDQNQMQGYRTRKKWWHKSVIN